MPNERDPAYDFRPVTAADMTLLAGWLAAPHVARWWGDTEAGLREIAGIADTPSVEAFIVLMNGTPMAYIQSYDIHGEDGHPYQDHPKGSFGIDLSIGDAALTGRGHGPRIITAFVERLFRRGAPAILIDPHPDNAQAIRAYEKAGFRKLGPRTTEAYGPAMLMTLENPDIDSHP